MLYYLALAWNPSDPEQRDSAHRQIVRFMRHSPQWETALEQPGLAVFYFVPEGPNIHHVYTLHRQQGVVLGKLFERDYVEHKDTHESVPQAVNFDERRSEALLNSGGRDLIKSYWGQYVAFLRNRSGELRVLRDPSGGMPCQWMRVQGLDVYFVRLEDCERLDFPPLSINQRYVLSYLMFDGGCTRETGLTGVETVLPGECIEHRPNSRKHHFLWNSLEIAQTDIVENASEAAELMRSTVRACTHAWASSFNRILLHLSGGLDSSIIASCLADAPVKTRALCSHTYVPIAGSDERRYARLAAQQARLELLESQASTRHRFEFNREIPRALFPFFWWSSNTEARKDDEHFFRRHGIDSMFTGDGGDELFYSHGLLPTAVDYAWRHSLRPKLISIAMDDAVAQGSSLWQVLRLTQYYGLRKRPWRISDTIHRDRRPLMREEVKTAAVRNPQLLHPLYREAAAIPPGKFTQSYILTFGAPNVHLPSKLNTALTGVAPLKSQPFVELSLRIPLYVLRSGGRDRALARRAFAADIPQQITHRKTKASGDGQAQSLISTNINHVRELLLDGYLVRERIIDRGKLEQVLYGQLSRIDSGIAELCTYLNVEGWVRTWQKDSRQAAA